LPPKIAGKFAQPTKVLQELPAPLKPAVVTNVHAMAAKGFRDDGKGIEQRSVSVENHKLVMAWVDGRLPRRSFACQ
jgi:hypothetical protein